MAQNKLTDLNNHLFTQLERLNDEELKKEDIQVEVNRAKAISGLASQIVNTAKVTIEAMELVANGTYEVKQLPEMIGAKEK